MKTLLARAHRGFISMAVAIALASLSALVYSSLNMVSIKQSDRRTAVQKEQAFYSSHAGFNYALRNVRVLGNPNPLPEKQFLGSTINVVYDDNACGIYQPMSISSSQGSSTSSYSYSAGKEFAPDCLVEQTHLTEWTGATNNVLEGLRYRNGNPDCHGGDSLLTGLTMSWEPDSGERLLSIQIDGDPFEYSDAVGVLSGTYIDFGENETNIDNGAYHDIVFVFDSDMSATSPNIKIEWNVDDMPQCYQSDFTVGV